MRRECAWVESGPKLLRGKNLLLKNTVAGFISKGSLYKNGEINVPTKFPGFMHTPNEVYIDIYIYTLSHDWSQENPKGLDFMK